MGLKRIVSDKVFDFISRIGNDSCVSDAGKNMMSTHAYHVSSLLEKLGFISTVKDGRERKIVLTVTGKTLKRSVKTILNLEKKAMKRVGGIKNDE